MAGCGKQTAKWNFARAMNLAEAGHLEEAIELMEDALEQVPDDRQIKLNLARLLAENGQGELGIGHCDEHLESNPNDKLARHIRSTCLQYLGRFDQSLCDYKQSLSGRVSRTPVELNNLAYYRALAKKELAKAAVDIQSAIQSEEEEYWGCSYIVPLQVRTAVSAGLIARHIDQREQVLPLLVAKIEQYEQNLAIQDSMIKSLITQEMQDPTIVGDDMNSNSSDSLSNDAVRENRLYTLDLHSRFPFGEKLEQVLMSARSRREVEKNCLGVLLATRALIHEDLNCHRSSDRDRRRIQQLGFSVEKLIEELPNDQACLTTFRKACLFLDTRGFVSARRPWRGEQRGLSIDSLRDFAKTRISTNQEIKIPPSSYREALEDLDIAVLASQFMELALRSSLYNSPDLSAQQVEIRKKMATRMTAVLLYHRMEIHLRGGNQQAADKDQLSIQRLGFQPGAGLF